MPHPFEFDPLDPREPTRPISPVNRRIPNDPDPAERTGRMSQSELDELAKRERADRTAKQARSRKDEDDDVIDEVSKKPAKQHKAEEDSDFGPVKKPGGDKRLLLIIGVFALGLVILCGIGSLGAYMFWGKSDKGAAGVAGVMGISESREGESWTHADLIAYLKSKGLKFEASTEATFVGIVTTLKFPDNTVAHVRLFNSPQEAKDNMGATAALYFSWGRFLISAREPFEIRGQKFGGTDADKKNIEVIRKALK